ncbi:unnamed protein product [Allacma fusca]|uniref:AB hydrolase-1 domain-containing protein n=1 Tax=Allacma fusca TaxID=39272 RepID=A0A8J2NZF6_9HEXA|nr:unnamed protein product [Allacma fusca]
MPSKEDCSMFTPNPEKMQIEEFSIYWERFGTGPKVVLCITGLLGDITYSFYPVWRKLDPTKYTLIGLDLPGYGNSRPPDRNYFRPGQEFIFERDARLAKKLMEQLGYQKFSIIGSSGGGTVGFHIACHFPDFVEKLVICNTPFEIIERDALVFRFLSNLDNWPNDQKAYILRKYGRNYAEDVVKSWERYLQVELPAQSHTKRLQRNLENHLKAPTLCVLGLKDSVVPPDGARKMKERLPNMKIHEVTYGQHDHLSFLSEFVRVTENFLLN